MLQVKAGVMDEWFLTGTLTGTSGSRYEYSFTIIVCFIVFIQKILGVSCQSQDVSETCLMYIYIHIFSVPETCAFIIYIYKRH